jgi:AcrR family transcriptional regulator
LNVRIADADLTARARIRDAAIECFATDGFEAPVRTIAAAAGVSPGLITHHFGSKQALREECDTEVLRRYREVKTQGLTAPSQQLLSVLSDPGVSATLLVYILRAVLAGGQSARRFLDRLIEDMRPVMAQAVASGFIKASIDEEARLRELANLSLGGVLVRFLTSPPSSPEAFVASLHDPGRDDVLALLELYTRGLLADDQLLDDYLTFINNPEQRTES